MNKPWRQPVTSPHLSQQAGRNHFCPSGFCAAKPCLNQILAIASRITPPLRGCRQSSAAGNSYSSPKKNAIRRSRLKNRLYSDTNSVTVRSEERRVGKDCLNEWG